MMDRTTTFCPFLLRGSWVELLRWAFDQQCGTTLLSSCLGYETPKNILGKIHEFANDPEYGGRKIPWFFTHLPSNPSILAIEPPAEADDPVQRGQPHAGGTPRPATAGGTFNPRSRVPVRERESEGQRPWKEWIKEGRVGTSSPMGRTIMAIRLQS